jgi:hypothetical protein
VALLVALAACQSQPMPPASGAAPGDRVVTVTPNQGGTIRLAINGPSALRTQASAKVYADIDHLTVKLKRSADDSLAADAGDVPKNGTTTHVVFNNVTTGVTYYLEVDAIDVDGFSIAKTSPTKSDPIPVTDAATPTDASVDLHLQDGGGAALNFAFTSPTYFTATNYLIWLTNAAGTVVTSYKSTTATPTLTGLADGNYVAWAAAVDDASSPKIMTPARQLGAVTVTGGAVTAPAGGTVNGVFPNTVTQLATDANWNLLGIAVDSVGTAYGLDNDATSGTGGKVVSVANHGDTPVTVVGNGVGGDGANGDDATGSVIQPSVSDPLQAGLAIGSDDSIFIGDTGAKKARMVPKTTIGAGRYGIPSLLAGKIYNIGTAAVADSPKSVAIDAANVLYWLDGGSVRRMKDNGSLSTISPDPGVVPNSMTVDRDGNAYVTQGPTSVAMYPAQAGTYFGASMSAGSWQTLPNLTTAGVTFRHLAVDPVRNLYVADSNKWTIWALDSQYGIKYRVVGTGAPAAGLVHGGDPVSRSVVEVIGVAVSATGGLYFSTSDTMWRFP